MGPKNTVDVSIIVPDYNNGSFLDEFIQSVLNSTVLPKELIIIDDGSTDESKEVLIKFNSLDFLRIIRFTENEGLPEALNAGLNVASGKYIMRADPDDLMHPERIERQFNYMESHPEIDVLGCNVTYFHHNSGRDINSSNFPCADSEIKKFYQRGLNGIQHPTACIKYNIVQKYRYKKIFPGEDYEFFTQMAKDGCRFANLAESLYRMRVHPLSMTRNIKLQAIQYIFTTRDKVWGTRTSKPRVLSYYFFIRFYRSYQISGIGLPKFLYLFLAILSNPLSLFYRIKYNAISYYCFLSKSLTS